ncbi:PcfJ domain-containing protein [Deinococcus petrolearius]|uniref:PcfJ domain-containing protein n=1 Tax=Deinococcus petrolearius TaxID=1751295 RepID=A0ABW1DMH7_9DEIO
MSELPQTARRPRQSRAERSTQRHDGPRRVLWFLTYGQTGHEDQGNDRAVQCLWIRYAGGFQECILLPPRPQEAFQELTHPTGLIADLCAEMQAFFAEHVAPRIPAEHHARALKVHFSPHVLRATGLRDHPFTPGVREFYELTTHFSATSRLPRTGAYAPARYCRFTTVQERLRLQLKGKRLLLLTPGRIRNISAGRLPSEVQLSPEAEQGARDLAWELAHTLLSPAQLRHLKAYTARHRDLSTLLCAIRFPAFLTVPVLLQHAQFTTAQERRRLLRYQGGVKGYLRSLIGDLPRATQLITGPDRLEFARALHRSGLTSPDLKAAMLRYIPADSAGVVSYGLNFKWLVLQVGERVAAEKLLHGLSERDRVNVAPAFKPPLFPHRVHPPVSIGTAPNRGWGWGRGLAQPLPLKVQARPGRHFRIGGRDLNRVIMHLRDTRHLLEEIRVTQPDFLPPRGSLREIHDTLARIHRRLQQENREIPSATDERHAVLDQSLLCPTFGLLQFRRVAWTHDLIETSEQLHNCVSSYARAALCGEAILVVARDALNLPRLCVEIRKGQVVQYKLDHNQSPETADDLSTAALYLKLTGLRVKTTDLRRLPEGGLAVLPPSHSTPPVLEEDLPF